MNIILPDNSTATSTFRKDLLGGVIAIQCDAAVVRPSGDGSSVETVKEQITAIPTSPGPIAAKDKCDLDSAQGAKCFG